MDRRSLKEKVDSQAREYIDVEKGKKSVTVTINRYNFYTFQNRHPAILQKERRSYYSSNPTTIVARYFISIKDKPEADQDNFFKHGSVRRPPCLSNN